jgi:sec-independent protein translocase protein TatC
MARKPSQKPDGQAQGGKARDKTRRPWVRIGTKRRKNGDTMTVIAHISELRKRLIVCIVFFLVAFSLCFTRSEWFAAQLMGRAQGYSFVFISPAELFIVYVKLALIGGVTVTSPIILFQLWSFVRPGLQPKEKKSSILILTFGVLLFLGGAVFSYQIVLPLTLRFFIGLNTSDSIQAMVSIQEYFGYVITMLVAFGVVFELPIVVIFLTQFGLINPKFLQKNFKYAVLIILIFSAVITPPDVTSQILLAVPMMVLFEASILISQTIFRKKLAERFSEEEDEEAAEAEERMKSRQAI